MAIGESLRTQESFARALDRARGYLETPQPVRRIWPALAAAAAFALSSMVFATAAIMAPAPTLDPVGQNATGGQSFGPPLAGAVN